MLTKGTPIVIKIPVKINDAFTGDFTTIDGYLFDPSERDQLYAYCLEDVLKDTSHVYEMWKACDALGGRAYLANTDPDFNPQTTILCDKGHTQILGYFLTGTSLEEKGYIAPSGGWIAIASSHPVHPVADNNEDDSNTKIDDIPNHMFLIAWLAAGNVFIPDLPSNFERWLIAIGVPLNKRVAIMNTVSLRGVDIKLFDTAADHHMQQIKDPTERKKVRRTLQQRRDWIKELKERK